MALVCILTISCVSSSDGRGRNSVYLKNNASQLLSSVVIANIEENELCYACIRVLQITCTYA
jgi:hypothetical protein